MIPPHHRAFLKALAKLTVRSLLKMTPDEIKQWNKELDNRGSGRMADNKRNRIGADSNLLTSK